MSLKSMQIDEITHPFDKKDETSMPFKPLPLHLIMSSVHVVYVVKVILGD